MIRCLLVSASLATLTVGACATNAQTERQEMVDAGQLTGVTSEGDRVRCRTIRPTGSRMSERICLSQREWDDIEANAQQVATDRANSQVGLPTGGPRGPGEP
ncbi:hypothetical protein L2D00_13410 [Hyphomonadaceae bacterium BL14]|nr:hypothetical protein L2D00_13410 [Hyphomonadaceae bacterium BL14]